MKPRVVLVRHGHGPADDRVVSHLVLNGYEPVIRHPFDGDLLGDVAGDIAGTVIYGGGFNADAVQEHPFLREEYRWIDAVLESGLPTLGLCQGAQMIARHMGAWTGPREGGIHEFGYYQVRATSEGRDIFPETLCVAQAHFHTFDLPKGATRLARNDAYENQAFRMGDKVFGLQFHPEQTIEGFRRWQTDLSFNYGQPGAQSKEEQTVLMHRFDGAQAEWFYGFLARLFPRQAALGDSALLPA